MKRRSFYKASWLCLIAVTVPSLWLISSHKSFATTSIPMPVASKTIDGNNIDLLTGISRPSLRHISIGSGDSLLQRSYTFDYATYSDNFTGKLYTYYDRNFIWQPTAISYMGSSEKFGQFEKNSVADCSGRTEGGYIPPVGDPSTVHPMVNPVINGTCRFQDESIQYINPANPANDYTYLDSQTSQQKYIYTNSSGVKLTFDRSLVSDVGELKEMGILIKVDYPDGEILHIYYTYTNFLSSSGGEDLYEVSAVVSNYGYMLKYDYYVPAYGTPDYWSGISSVTVKAINLATDYCASDGSTCNLTHTWASWTDTRKVGSLPHFFGSGTTDGGDEYGYYTFDRLRLVSNSVIDAMGHNYVLSLGQFKYPSGREIDVNYPTSSIWAEGKLSQPPTQTGGGGASFDDFYGQDDSAPISNGACARFDPKLCVDGPFTANIGSNVWHYSYSARANNWVPPNPKQSVPGFNTHATAVITDPLGHSRTVISDEPSWEAGGRSITSETDENNRTVSFGYDGATGKLTSVSYPEGNKTNLTYDNRGNLIERRDVAKPGTGLADRVWSANYSATCAHMITCDKPNWVKDADGHETDYTYDTTTGQVLTETGPADANGVRPQKRYSYTWLYAKVKDASGNLVNAESPISKLTRVSECRAATPSDPASCVGSANETVTTYAYNNNNLLLTSETVAAGDGSSSAATSYDYDVYGNRVMVDGPRTDVDDRSYTSYDALRRPVYEIGVDPDGSGPLQRVVIHHVYDVDGNEIRTETGTGSAITFDGDGAPTGVSDFAVTSFKRMTFDPSTGLLVKTEVVQP